MKLEKVSNIIKKEIDSEPVYNEKCYNGKNSMNFHNNKITKEGFQCICLSVILTDSVYRKDKSYYPQVLLEECTCCCYRKVILILFQTTYKFLLMILTEKILMKKTLMKKIKYRNLFRKI